MISGIQFNLDQYIASNGIFCLLCQRWKEMNDWTNKWIEWEGRFDGTAISTLCFFDGAMHRAVPLVNVGERENEWNLKISFIYFSFLCALLYGRVSKVSK